MLGTLKVLRAMINARWEWFSQKAQTPHAEVWLATYSFFESILLPFPTDPFLAVMVYANKRRWVWLAVITTLSSVAGAVVGYIVAYFLYSTLGAPLADLLGVTEQIQSLSQTLRDYTFSATFIGAFTPIPYTPVILAAGFLKANFFLFILASILARGLRYGLVAVLTYVFGVSIVPRLGKWANTITILGIVVLCFALLFILLF